MFGLDDSVLSWLAATASEAVGRRIGSNSRKTAVRQVVREAINGAVARIRHLDDQQSAHLSSVLQEHNGEIGYAEPADLARFRGAVRSWVATLDHPEYDGVGYLSGIGVDVDDLSEELANGIITSILEHGRAGGPLQELAEWLWRDALVGDIEQIRQEISRLRGVDWQEVEHADVLPGNVPHFTGRQQVLKAIANIIGKHDPAGSLVAVCTIDGMPGVGKTEVAIRVAHEHKHRYHDGQHFINLHGYAGDILPVAPHDALEDLLRQAGTPGQAIPPDLAGRQARWRALMARRRSIILIDNALSIEQVLPLLPASPSCLVLITSRSRLAGLPGCPFRGGCDLRVAGRRAGRR